LQPHFRNFNKRVVKSPKIYFFDTGLLCYLLKIQTPEQLSDHPSRGSIFENWVISETMKSYYNRGEEPPLYFWRDAKGHEVDLIIDKGTSLYPIEIKSASTFDPSFTSNLQFFLNLQERGAAKSPAGDSVYTGDDSFDFKDFKVISWKMLKGLG
ncbi:MAG: DUF4143 domain-containing protein, partial [Deltaproteobacteria bacterium]|nr:DUF4143 domain-containing protein [Deltaproteobacteria bacterium]